MSAFVAVLRIELHFPEGTSLKGKRKELAPIKNHLGRRLGAAIAEVDHQDRWQRSTLAVALVAGSLAGVESAADAVGRWLDARFPDGVVIERRIASFEDLAV